MGIYKKNTNGEFIKTLVSNYFDGFLDVVNNEMIDLNLDLISTITDDVLSNIEPCLTYKDDVHNMVDNVDALQIAGPAVSDGFSLFQVILSASDTDPDKRDNGDDLVDGDIYYNTDDEVFKNYYQGTWEEALYIDVVRTLLYNVNIDSDITAKLGYTYLCDISKNDITITCPKDPDDNLLFHLSSYLGNYKDYKIIIDGNGKKINGKDSITITDPGITYSMQFNDDKDEWLFNVIGMSSLRLLFGNGSLPAPIIGSYRSEIGESDTLKVEIINYDKDVTYTLTGSNDTAKSITNDDSVPGIVVEFNSIDEDINVNFTITATKPGYINSFYSSSIELLLNNEESDDAIINDAFEDNEDSSTNADVSNPEVKFNDDNGTYIETVTKQGDDETKWVSYQTISNIDIEPMTIGTDDTDTDTLVVKEDIINESECYIVNNNYPDGVEIDIGDVEDDSKDTTDTLDIFDDDSAIELFEFEDSLDGKSGNYSMTDNSDGKISFEDDGKFGKYLSKYSDDGKGYPIQWNDITDKLKDNDKGFTISLWVYFDSNNEPDDHFRLYDFYHTNRAYIYITTDFTKFEIDSVKKDMSDYLEKDKWQHIVLSYSDYVSRSHDVKVYINNEYIDTWSCDGVDSADQNSGFGGDNDSEEKNYWAGRFDQVRVFDKDDIIDDEVDKLYNEKYKIYKADISSNDLDDIPTQAFFIDKPITISTAISLDDIVDGDYQDEEIENYVVKPDDNLVEYTYKKVFREGTNFQRKILGDKDSKCNYLKTLMWKDD